MIDQPRSMARALADQNRRSKGLTSALSSVGRFLFLAMVVLLPLPFGGARPWAWTLTEVVIGTCGLLLATRLAIGETAWVPLKGLRIAALFFGLVLLWSIVQVLPG